LNTAGVSITTVTEPPMPSVAEKQSSATAGL
jgi:hypothetical protein